MSDSILSGDVTIYYLDENRQKRLEWTGSASGTRTVNELYSALQDWFDEPGQMDDGIPMSAQTPVEYTLGIIDSGDLNPWYMSYEMAQHLTGGAIRTNGWTHVDSSAIGIIVVPVTAAGNTIVSTDVGYDISGATTGNGTLLDVISLGGTNDYLVIRPDTNAAGDNFTTNSQVITVDNYPTYHTGSQAQAGSNTGEQIWANLYSIGTIEAKTHVYVYQGPVNTDTGRVRVVGVTDQTQDWWGDGHIDMLLYTKDFKTSTMTAIDAGYATVFARKPNTLYDSFEVSTSLTSGGRNPIPLATAPDLDNTTGYKSITFTAGSGSWNVGDEINGDSSLARAVITQIDNPGSTQTLHYYLIGAKVALTDFSSGAEGVTNVTTTATGTKDGNPPADQGPALQAWFSQNAFPTTSYTAATADIDDDSADEYYGVTIDCLGNLLTEVYEWIKYVMRQGNTATTNADGIPANSYIGGEVYLAYTGSVSSGTVEEGDDVSQATSLATGVVISHDTTNKVLLLRNTRGIFSTSYVVTSQDNSGQFTPDAAAALFSPKKASPLGTFAGGTFFGARGVLLANWATADENKFQLTPIEGGTKVRPTAIQIEVTNLVGTDETTTTDDTVAVFRLTGSGGGINKTEYSAAGGEAIGDNTIVVDTGIAVDVPGKTAGGVLRLRDASADYKGYRIRYASWATSTFTLATITVASAEGGTNTTTIVSTGSFTNAKRGDIVVNNGNGHDGISYVVSVDSANQVTISPAITGQTTGDAIKLNAVPIAIDTADDVYVSLIDVAPTSSSASCSIVYSSPIYFRVVVRNSHISTPDGPILPFTANDSTSGTSRSIATIRTPDAIIS